MEVVHEVCCGLDVHKKGVTACVLWASGRRRQTRAFGTFTRELLELGDWLRACGVTHVAMESTGVYWKPVWNLLEGQFEVLLVNAQHIKAVPGRKTDQKDSEWIADLLQHGLLRASFVPPTPIRELRDLTRYRASLAQEINRIANRIQKVLEDANIKLASVATDALGASGRAMLEAMVKGEQDSQRLAEMAQGKLRNKIPELQGALQGRVSRHHRFLLRELLDHLYFVESKMQRIEQEVAERLGPFQSEVARLCTIPGVDRVTAWGLLAEIGLSMKQFPDAQHLASWAGLCPGSHESAGKRKSGKIRKGSLWLRRCLCQGAWAVSTKKNNYLSALYRRLAVRRGSKRATIAVAHKLLIIAYYILRDGTCYSDLGADYFDRLNPEGLRRRLTKRLEGLGFKVTLEPLAQVA
ncbi:MAG: IS116/IS110/IS902-like transposase [Candidatus Acidoferrum typicum]|nr:IS116/IS110/IS902-like transposase [Candidatus Acidoferrum typicum]